MIFQDFFEFAKVWGWPLVALVVVSSALWVYVLTKDKAAADSLSAAQKAQNEEMRQKQEALNVMIKAQQEQMAAMLQQLLDKSDRRREDTHKSIGEEVRREAPWRQRMSEEIERVKDALDASRIELFELHNGSGPQNKCTVVQESLHSSEIESWGKKFHNIPMSLFPNLMVAISEGDTFTRDDISQTEYAERFLVGGASGRMSVVIVPMQDNNGIPFAFLFVGWEGDQVLAYIPRDKVSRVKELSAMLRGMYLAIGDAAKQTGPLDPDKAKEGR